MTAGGGPQGAGWARRIALAGALAVGLAGLACWAVSALPFEVVKARLDALASDGDVEWFTPAEFARRAFGLRVLGAVLLAVAAGLFVKRDAVGRVAGGGVLSLAGYVREAAARMADALRSQDRGHRALFWSFLAVGVGARVVFLFQPIRYDEAFTLLNFAARPWPVALSDYSWPNNHIFHTALVRVSYLLFGSAEWAIRLPAFLAGTLIPPATYMVVRTFYGARGALLAMGLTAVSSPLVLYSTNARGYTLLTLAALLLLAVVRDQHVRTHPGGWPAIVILSALGAFTLPVMLYPFGIAMLWLALSVAKEGGRWRPVVWTVAGVGAATLLLYLPAVFNTGLASIVSNQSVRTRAWSLYLSELPTALRDIWSAWNVDHGLVVTGLLVAGLVVHAIRHGHVARDRVPLWAVVIAWTVALTVANRGIPFVRVWLFLVPLYLGFAAVGLQAAVAAFAARMGRPVPPQSAHRAVALVLTLWVGINLIRSGSAAASDETGTMRDAREVVEFLEAELEPGDGVLAKIPADGPLMYYFVRRGRPAAVVEGDPVDARTLFVVVNNHWGETLDEVLEDAESAGRNTRSVEHVRDFAYSSLYRLPPEGG